MVLAERNSESARNGRRSRGPSPNGHASESSSEEEGEKIRVGRDYQAVVPECIPLSERRPEQCSDRALLVWSPTNSIPDYKLDEYISLAKEKYGYNGEQALGMLFWHKHDLERAILDLANFTPFPDEWTVEDKVLFEQAFQFHGKSFHRIRQMLPDKTIASLVRYYYSWKKTRSRTSLMDRQARKLAAHREEGSEGGSELGSNTDSDSDDKKWTIHRGIRRKSGSPPRAQNAEDGTQKDGAEGGKNSCANCGVSCTHTHVTPKGNMCSTCYQHWRRTGSVRPTTGPVKRDRHMHSLLRHKRKPPRGMYINHDDLVAMASSQGGGAGAGGEHMLKAMDREIVSLKRQVQNNKQTLSALRRKTSEGIDEYRPLDSNTRINARWTNDELLLAVQGVRKYGKDFRAIAEVLGTKTEAHVRSYFVNYRRRYNLDAVLKEFEAENGPIVDAEADKDEKMETDGVSSGSEASTPTPGGSSPVTVTSSAAGGSAGTAAVIGSTGAGSGPVASPGKNSSGFPKTPPVGPGQAAK
ncbi:REST corepressor 3 [Schistocerca piceifrons]|uniref:REST corepressor 3 n=1 Tax=Schistocerca piceifrons TaxID=274613 RepID=UPI001F5E56F6|nr:REST corepressor 3 [Schistocerca piceifrons]